MIRASTYSRSTGINLTSSLPNPSARRSSEFSLVQDQLLATHTCLNSCLPLARHQGQSPHSACAIPMPTPEVCSVVLTSFNLWLNCMCRHSLMPNGAYTINLHAVIHNPLLSNAVSQCGPCNNSMSHKVFHLILHRLVWTKYYSLTSR